MKVNNVITQPPTPKSMFHHQNSMFHKKKYTFQKNNYYKNLNPFLCNYINLNQFEKLYVNGK